MSLLQVRESVRRYLSAMVNQQSGEFQFTNSGSSCSLLSNAFGLLLSRLLKWEPENTRAAIDVLVNLQNQSGLFTDARIPTVSSSVASHDATYLQHQQTFLALLALEASGVSARYPLEFARNFESKSYLENWLSGLDWGNPWYASNSIMFVLKFLLYEFESRRTQNATFVDFVLSWLDDHQDPVTGLWDPKRQVDLHNRVAAAYHFLFFYTYRNRPIQHLENIIDSVLVLQSDTGLFSPYASGGACDDLDAIDILVRCSLSSPHRRDDIKRALSAASFALKAHQNDDGGFCYSKPPSFDLKRLLPPNMSADLNSLVSFWVANLKWQCKSLFAVLGRESKWSFSGIPSTTVPIGSSDIFSTYFRVLALALCDVLLTSGEAGFHFSKSVGFSYLNGLKASFE